MLRTFGFRGAVFPARGVVTAAGGCLLLLALAVDFSYSNLNTYVISYLRAEVDGDLNYTDWQWISTGKLIVAGVFMPLAGRLTSRIGVGKCNVIGCTVYTGVLALIGGILIFLGMAVDFTYSNLNTYVISYLRAEVDPDLTYANWQWVSTGRNIIAGVLMPVAGDLTRKIGVRTSNALGCTIYIAGYALTYYALDAGLPAVVTTIGLCHGVGFALVYSQTVMAVMKWFPDDQGFMTSFAVAGYGLGGVVWTPIETAYVNPDDVSAQDVPGEEDKYFLDEDLLSRVPSLFLLLAGLFAIMQIPSLFLVREPTKEELRQIHDILNEDGDEGKSEQKINQSGSKGHGEDASIEAYSVTPRNVLKTREFYKLWFSFFAISMGNGIFNNYSKSFGQIYISDDSFFAASYTASQVLNAVSRIFWGRMYDAAGYQFCVFVIGSLLSFFTFSFVDLEAFPEDSTGAKVFYTVWIMGIFATLPGIYSCFAPVTMLTYGPEHYAANYGLLFTMNIAYSLLLLLITQTMFDALGYFGLFFISGGLGMIGMLTTYLIPDKFDSEQYRERFEGQKIK